MSKIYTAIRETGTFIDEVVSIEEGKRFIDLYENDDKKNECFEENSYDIVDEEHCSLL